MSLTDLTDDMAAGGDVDLGLGEGLKPGSLPCLAATNGRKTTGRGSNPRPDPSGATYPATGPRPSGATYPDTEPRQGVMYLADRVKTQLQQTNMRHNGHGQDSSRCGLCILNIVIYKIKHGVKVH